MPRFVRSELGVELKDTILNGSSIVRVSVCGCCQGFLNSGSLEGVSLGGVCCKADPARLGCCLY